MIILTLIIITGIFYTVSEESYDRTESAVGWVGIIILYIFITLILGSVFIPDERLDKTISFPNELSIYTTDSYYDYYYKDSTNTPQVKQLPQSSTDIILNSKKYDTTTLEIYDRYLRDNGTANKLTWAPFIIPGGNTYKLHIVVDDNIKNIKVNTE